MSSLHLCPLGLLFLIPVSLGEASEPASALREWFLSEYPKHEQALRDATKNVVGEARYLSTQDPFNRHKTRIGDMTWVALSFFKAGDSLRIDREFPLEMVNDSNGTLARTTSLVKTPQVTFDVFRPKSRDAQLGMIAHEPRGRIRRALGVAWREFLPATYRWADHPIIYWLKKDGFSVGEVTHEPDDPQLVQVAFTWDGEGLFRDGGTPADFRLEGFWVLDPENDWAVRRTWMRYRYTFGDPPMPSGEEEEITVTVQRLGGGQVLPRRVAVDYRDPTQPGSPTVYQRIMEFDELLIREPAPDTFAFETLGVSDPRRSNASFLLLNIGAALLIAGLFVWRRRTSRRASRLPIDRESRMSTA